MRWRETYQTQLRPVLAGVNPHLDRRADRTLATTMRTSQLSLRFASFAYVLICALRRIDVSCLTHLISPIIMFIMI